MTFGLSLLGILVVVLALRYLLRRTHISISQFVLISITTVIAIALLVLGLTGRLHWLFAVLGAFIPFARRSLSFLRLVPLIRSLSGFRGWPGGIKGSRPSSGGKSTVQTRFIDMVLDHDSGHMEGSIIEGDYRGKQLSDLQLAELLQLLGECRADNDSASVLQAYLDREEPSWREHAASNGSGQDDSRFSDKGAKGDRMGGTMAGTMDERQALEILSLQAGATREEIIAAHRRLMQKLHPDRGGSTYLAAQINEAKDFLLG